MRIEYFPRKLLIAAIIVSAISISATFELTAQEIKAPIIAELLPAPTKVPAPAKRYPVIEEPTDYSLIWNQSGYASSPCGAPPLGMSNGDFIGTDGDCNAKYQRFWSGYCNEPIAPALRVLLNNCSRCGVPCASTCNTCESCSIVRFSTVSPIMPHAPRIMPVTPMIITPKPDTIEQEPAVITTFHSGRPFRTSKLKGTW